MTGKGKTLVRPERFELPTYCSGGNRSIHLSYGRAGISLHPYGGSIGAIGNLRRRSQAGRPASIEKLTRKSSV